MSCLWIPQDISKSGQRKRLSFSLAILSPTANTEIAIITQNICSLFASQLKKKLNNIGFQFIKVELFVSLLLFLGIYRICISSA